MYYSVIKKLSAVMVGLSLSACLPAETGTQGSAATVSDPVVTADFGGGLSGWNDGSVLLFRFTAIERDSEIFVCGAYASEGLSYTSQFNRELLRRSSATVNGEPVLRNLTFFQSTPAEMIEAELVGSQTRCRSTGLAAGSVALGDIAITLRSGRVRIRV